MWCKCEILKGVNVGCLNIPYSSTNKGDYCIRIKKDGDYLNFNNATIEDVFIIIKKVDDDRAVVFEKLSLINGGVVVDIDDSTRIKIAVTGKMLDKSLNNLYYQMFIKEEDKVYFIMKGTFIHEKNYN